MALLGKNHKNLAEQYQEIQSKLERLTDEYNFNRIESDLYAKVSTLHQSGFIFYNFSTHKLYISSGLLTLFEPCLPSTPATPADLIENVHIEDRAFLQEIFDASVKIPRKKNSGQFRLVQKIKESREIRFFNANAIYEINDREENTMICAVREITKETKQLRDLQKNLEKASESDKIKTLFLLNISHNIRTPMNSILGFAELLSLTDPGPDRRKEFIQVIKKQSKTLLQLIDNVAEIAKYESGSMTISKTAVNLNLLIEDIVKEVENGRNINHKNQVRIITAFPDQEGIDMYTDAGRIHQIFINLINHSLRYTSQGFIELGYKLPADNRVDFFVRDTSHGISKEEVKNIFDLFAQPNIEEIARYEDETGLGLNIARSIVKLLGGRIGVEANPETGLTFSFSIPFESIPDTSHRSVEDELTLNKKYKWNDKVILIVEDEEVNGLFLEAVFQETGAQTLYAKNGLQALELCKSINKIDLILMDIRMPVMNGLKATQEIRKINQFVPIIAQTALTLEEDRQNCLHAGCSDSIIKPIDIEELLHLVNRYFSH